MLRAIALKRAPTHDFRLAAGAKIITLRAIALKHRFIEAETNVLTAKIITLRAIALKPALMGVSGLASARRDHNATRSYSTETVR